MLGLKPFFCYFGGKWRVAPKYPSPHYDIIIEPFGGAAGYSTRYYQKQVILYEIDPKIYGIWDYIIKTKENEILNLPIEIDHIDNLKICQEAKYLIGMWLNKGVAQPALTPSNWMRQGKHTTSFWGPEIRRRIAKQSNLVKHWTIRNRSYTDIDNVECTYFIDPPYHNSGKYYKYNMIDYNHLSEWCQTRHGQVIVCEQEGANWLPFREFATIKVMESNRGKKQSKEVIWTK